MHTRVLVVGVPEGTIYLRYISTIIPPPPPTPTMLRIISLPPFSVLKRIKILKYNNIAPPNAVSPLIFFEFGAISPNTFKFLKEFHNRFCAKNISP